MGRVIPNSPATCECTDCPWQGRWHETDGGSCPDCHADVVPINDDQPAPEA